MAPEIRKLEGNPGKRPIPEAITCREAGSLAAPEWLDALAKEFWNRYAGTLSEMGVLKAADLDRYAMLCDTWSRWREADGMKRVAWLKQLNACMDCFGMSAIARTRMKLDSEGGKQKSRLNDFVSKRKQPGTPGNLRVVPPDGAERAAN